MRRLVQRGQRAAAGRPASGLGRVVRGRRDAVEPGDPPAQVLGPRGLGPVVVDARARLARLVALESLGLVEVAGDRAQRDTRARGDHRVVAQRPAQHPHRGAQVGPRVRHVGPEPGGQRVALVRAGVQSEEREQPPMRRRQRHRPAVAERRDVPEKLHPQHVPDGIRTSGPRASAFGVCCNGGCDAAARRRPVQPRPRSSLHQREDRVPARVQHLRQPWRALPARGGAARGRVRAHPQLRRLQHPGRQLA